MKKIISLMLAVLVVLSLAACGNFDQKVYFVGTWTGAADPDKAIPEATMTLAEDLTGKLVYGDVTYDLEWMIHPANPEIMLVKKMVADGETHVPTNQRFRCPDNSCRMEYLPNKIVDNKCPKCSTEYEEGCEISAVIRCTYTVVEGEVKIMVTDDDGLDSLTISQVLAKQP